MTGGPPFNEPPVASDISAERSLIGTLLNWSERIPEASDAGLTPAHFSLLPHGVLFERLLEQYAAGAPIDPRSVIQACEDRGQLDLVGGVEYVVDIDRGVPRGLDVRAYAHQIQLDAARRRVIRECDDTKAAVLADRYAITNGLSARHLANFTTITDAIAPHRDDVLLDVEAQIAAHAAYIEHEAEETVQTGFPGLDDLTGGTRAGEVLGIMARPGTGKTLLVGNIVDFVLQTAATLWVLFVSLEMPTAQIVERAMRITLGLSSYKLREQRAAGVLNLDAYRRRYARQLLVDRPGLSLAQIGELVRRAQAGPAKDGKLLLVIDHFGLLGGDRGASVYERVSTQAREIKELAKRHNIPVMVAIQVSRDAGGDGSKELGLGAARDSGVIEEAMDYLVALRQPSRQPGLSPQQADEARDKILLKLVKNRHGALGQEMALRLDPLSLRMWESA
ncbi:MAG: DnaB-like helicase C-terminal domain-containing protein [Acidobacteriota bacterium]